MITQIVLWLMTLFAHPSHSIKAPTTHYHGYELNRKAIEKAKDFTVLISAEGFGSVERGSGVLIDSMTVLTCYHVAAAENEMLWVIPQPGNAIYHAKVWKTSPSDDLAELKLDRPVPKRHYATFQEGWYAGEPISIIGNILGGMHWFVSYGIISDSTSQYLLTDGLVLGGDSGGPWINEKGEVVAISDWGMVQGAAQIPIGLNGGVKAQTILDFIYRPTLLDILELLFGGK
jgi:S1-C subfamily serine protease